MGLTVGSLFSGIGGLDLGLERAGMKVIWQSEIDPYACKVLSKHWPEVVNHGDIKDIKWGDIVRPDVLCGGYPCQPFSTAGKRRGEEDPRHLWPWVREAISQLRPKYAILENVRGHLSLGGVSVIGELADIGYDAEWRIVSAASVGAHHRRDRVVIVAYPNNSRPHRAQIYSAETRFDALGWLGGCSTNVGDTHGKRRERSRELSQAISKRSGLDQSSEGGGWSGIWEPEPNVGRVAHGVPHRLDRLRGLGNAVVPQVAEVIGRLVISDYQRRED
jgi:DNA (cytosine-5)-methyltransferase 1